MKPGRGFARLSSLMSKQPLVPPFKAVKSEVNFPQIENAILTNWDTTRIFEKTLKESAEKKAFSFYDGPPFATGLPHYGHILAGVLKDIVPRYWTMKGYRVARVFGWDCHGLPIEYEINKTLGIENRKQVLAMGVDKYNAACRGIVDRYTTEWKKTVRRVGRWVDMENAYFTMSVPFMQSVWWVFKQMFEKGLIYEGYKVVPYSVGVSTPLSNFEASQNYKEVQDPALTVSFQSEENPNLYFLAWTTTPWTLPSNLALAVGKEFDYVEVKENSSGKQLILAQALLPKLFKNPDAECEVLKVFKGSELLGKRYVPLFSYFEDKKSVGAFRVIESSHVTLDSGTGIVHIAPAFGEDDYYACVAAKIPVVNPVDDDGMFTAEVANYQGRRVKEADKDIIAELKKAGKLFKQETITHSYPFCWRSDTPLIYRAVSSWFVSVETIKAQLLKNNQKTAWVPEALRDGRFGNWLENARDWAISRNRFWGTPLPIWRNPEGEIICIGSARELEQLSGVKVNDLHIDTVDKITIPSPTGKSPLKRIDGVLDCWFESGSMPYAQWGYPETNQAEFKKNFPADFIAEGLDQTRGWFYTLMVIGTALFDEAPFRNVIVNGLILAEDGKKMSKSLRNYPDPMEVLDRHGADALRLYLIDSPVVKAQEIRFSENGVREITRRILLRWWNAYSFFVNYANVDQFVPRGDYIKSPNELDRWILSRLSFLIENTEKEMAAYRLYNVVPSLLQFIEDLTNTYIRFNRGHFWKDGMPEDKRYAYETLYYVLVTLSKMMAPFAPFLSEETYQNLSTALPKQSVKESVHLESFPDLGSLKELRNLRLEHSVRVMETVVMQGRNLREKMGIKTKIPLKRITLIHRDLNVLAMLKPLEPYFCEELNVQSVVYESKEEDFVKVFAKANFPTLGKRLGPKMKAIAAQIEKIGLEQILKLEAGESVLVDGEAIGIADVEIRRVAKKEGEASACFSCHQLISIEYDPTVSEEQKREGLMREVLRKIQQARKNAKFNLDDRIELQLIADGEIKDAVVAHEATIKSEALVKKFSWVSDLTTVHQEVIEFEEGKVSIGLTRVDRA